TCDMKGFLACVLAAAPDFKRRDLAIPLHLIFSYDEEVGCLGVRPLIDELGRTLAEPEMILVGEPTSMAVVDAHKGIHAFATEVHGRSAHTSMPHLGVNAISIASRIVAEIDSLAAEMRDRRDGERFTPPYTTISVGKIEGGTALNVIPRQCRVVWHFRGVPATDPEEIPRRLTNFVDRELLPAMTEIDPETAVETRMVGGIPSFSARPGSAAVSLALRLSRQNDVQAVSYGTEAGLFEAAGRATVVCGPGDIAQAHTADEFIEEDQLAECMGFLERLGDHAARG
ncbi:MAG: M20/M25/M40 family metallo-hydrolase, partial [Methyloligellaceae bacterium]